MTRECLLRVVRPAPRSGARGRGDGASSVSRLMCPCQYFSSAIRYFDTSSANTSSTTTPTVSIPNFGIPQRAEPRASAASPGQDRPTTPSRRLLLSRSFCRRTIGTVGRFRGIDQLAVETNSEFRSLRAAHLSTRIIESTEQPSAYRGKALREAERNTRAEIGISLRRNEADQVRRRTPLASCSRNGNRELKSKMAIVFVENLEEGRM